MNTTEQLLMLMSAQLATNNAMLLDLANSQGAFDKPELETYTKEIIKQADILATLVKGEQ